MSNKKVELNKKIADEIETLYRNGSTVAKISSNLLIPAMYISAILASREVPLNPRKKKTRVKLVDTNIMAARLNDKEEEFLNLIIDYPEVNLFATERDKTIVYERLGINRDCVMKYEEIGALHSITRERVRQIVDSSFKRAKIAVKRDRAKKAIELQNLSALSDIKEEIKNEYHSITNDMGIEYLDLSVRAYNSLVRKGIRTITDLCSKTESEVSKIRNIGFHTYIEIISKLKQHGINLLAD